MTAVPGSTRASARPWSRVVIRIGASAMAAARGYCDVATGHGADAERIDRAHCVETTSVQCDPVACVPVSEGIGADDPFVIEHDEVATAELLEQRLNGCLAQSCTLRKRAWGRSSSVF